MDCLGGDDVIREATIEKMLQAVFSASPLGALGGYIIRPTKLSSVSAVSAVQWNGVAVAQLAVKDSRGKFAVEEEVGL
jgi:hypothetical protein